MSAPGTPAPMPVIVGAPRSGTTLLRLMLDAHPELAIPPETHFLGEVSRLTGGQETLPGRFVSVIETTSRARGTSAHAAGLREAVTALPEFDIGAGLRTYYRLYAQRMDKPRWGDKTPDYSAIMPAIERMLPEARFVHLIRDGRDVALSQRRTWFAQSNVEVLATEWRKRVLVARRDAARVRHYLEVRYERLVEDPRRELERVCGFIDLPFDPAMLDHHLTAARRLGEVGPFLDARGGVAASRQTRLEAHSSATRPLDPSLAGRWRTEMRALDVLRFERIAGDLLDELGYEARALGPASRLALSPFRLHPRLAAYHLRRLRRPLRRRRPA